jgi:hypothetical protein
LVAEIIPSEGVAGGGQVPLIEQEVEDPEDVVEAWGSIRR